MIVISQKYIFKNLEEIKIILLKKWIPQMCGDHFPKRKMVTKKGLHVQIMTIKTLNQGKEEKTLSEVKKKTDGV